MYAVILALLPAAIVAVYLFGLPALRVMAICVTASVAIEALWQKIAGQPVDAMDGSAVLTGLLVAFNLPPSSPYWLALAGAVIAIVVGKQVLPRGPTPRSATVSTLASFECCNLLGVVVQRYPLMIPCRFYAGRGSRGTTVGVHDICDCTTFCAETNTDSLVAVSVHDLKVRIRTAGTIKSPTLIPVHCYNTTVPAISIESERSAYFAGSYPIIAGSVFVGPEPAVL